MDLISLYQANLMDLAEIRKELSVVFEKACNTDNPIVRSELLRLVRIELDIMKRAADLAVYKLERLDH